MINILGQSYILATRLDGRSEEEWQGRKLSKQRISALISTRAFQRKAPQSGVLKYVSSFFLEIHAWFLPKNLKKCSTIEKY